MQIVLGLNTDAKELSPAIYPAPRFQWRFNADWLFVVPFAILWFFLMRDSILLLVWGAFIISFMFFELIRRYRMESRIVSNPVVGVGRVEKISYGRKGSVYVTFAYISSDGTRHSRKLRAHKKAYAESQPVEVVYNSCAPKDSVLLHEFEYYEVAP